MQTLSTILVVISGFCVGAAIVFLLVYFFGVRPELEGRHDSEAEAARAKVSEATRFLIGSMAILVIALLLRE